MFLDKLFFLCSEQVRLLKWQVLQYDCLACILTQAHGS